MAQGGDSGLIGEITGTFAARREIVQIVDVVNRNRVESFVTKDTSIIREILAPRNAPQTIRHQSLAEATLPPGAATDPHYHPVTEEIYYILQGSGTMRIGDEVRAVFPGDGIAIPPGAPHQIANHGQEDLVFLCCCAPAYTHEDTVIVDLPPIPPIPSTI